jgi:hypothetical protein
VRGLLSVCPHPATALTCPPPHAFPDTLACGTRRWKRPLRMIARLCGSGGCKR